MHRNSEYFKQWLVGFIDGDGSFIIVFYHDTVKFTFKLGLTLANHNVLIYIRERLGNIGTISNYQKKNSNSKLMVTFSIQDRTQLINIILPIFDKYPCLTSKQFRYQKFRECLLIYDNPNMSRSKRTRKVKDIWETPIPKEYYSPVLKPIINLNHFSSKQKISEA